MTLKEPSHSGSFILFLSCFFLCFRVRLFIDASWSTAGKGLTSWLSFVMSNCEVVTFPLVSLVRCGAWLYRFLIFALFLTSVSSQVFITVNNAAKLFYRLVTVPFKLNQSVSLYLLIRTPHSTNPWLDHKENKTKPCKDDFAYVLNLFERSMCWKCFWSCLKN